MEKQVKRKSEIGAVDEKNLEHVSGGFVERKGLQNNRIHDNETGEVIDSAFTSLGAEIKDKLLNKSFVKHKRRGG